MLPGPPPAFSKDRSPKLDFTLVVIITLFVIFYINVQKERQQETTPQSTSSSLVLTNQASLTSYNLPVKRDDPLVLETLSPTVTPNIIPAASTSFRYIHMISQISKPLICAKHGYWIPNTEPISSESRLNSILEKQNNNNNLILSLLRPTDLMLQWGGCDDNSYLFAERVGELHMVEYQIEIVKYFRHEKGLYQNQAMHYMPSIDAEFPLSRPPSSLTEFQAYMKAPLHISPSCFKITNAKFDIIYINGRSRPQCAYQALVLLRQDGLLILNDWEVTTGPEYHPYYRIILRWYDLLYTENNIGVFRVKREKDAIDYFKHPGEFPTWWITKSNSRMDVSKKETLPSSEPFQ